MSYVVVEPQIMSAFAANLSGIGSALGAANAAAAASTTGLLAAAADEVSVQIAALFSANAAGYQQVSAQVAASYERFVQAVTAGANAYAAVEANTVQNLVTGLTAPALSVEGLGEAYAGFTANVVNAEMSFNQSLVGAEVALRQAALGSGNALSRSANVGFNLANSFVGGGQQAVNLLLGAQVPAGFDASLAINSALNANLGLGGLSGAFGAGLAGLGAQLTGALSGVFGGGLPDFSGLALAGNALAGNLNAGLTGLAQTGGMLATSLSSSLAGLAQTGGSLAGGLNAALSGLTGGFDVTLPVLTGGFTANLPALLGNGTGGLSAFGAQLGTALSGALSGSFALPNLAALTQAGATLAGNVNGGLSALGGQISAALTGVVNGDTAGLTALVNAAAGLPTGGLARFEQLQSGILARFVDNQIAFNQALVATEIALLGPPALAGPVGYAVNAANLLVGTGQRFINAVVGAPSSAALVSSLLFSPELAVGGFPVGGGLTGVAHQLLSLNAALGGIPGLDTSLLTQLGLTPTGLQALVDSQLAFNANLVANQQLLQVLVFGTGGALNGAVNNAFNGLNLLLVGTPQGAVNALLGAPVADLTGSLLVSAPGDVFGGLTAGGLLGALQQKFLFDAAVLSNLAFPIQLTLTGGLPSLLTQLNATLTAALNGTGTIGGTVGGTVAGTVGGNVATR